MDEILDKALTVIHQEIQLTNLILINRNLYDLGEITKEEYIQSLLRAKYFYSSYTSQ